MSTYKPSKQKGEQSESLLSNNDFEEEIMTSPEDMNDAFSYPLAKNPLFEKPAKQAKFKLPYEWTMWIIFIAFATFAVVDRFTGPEVFGSPDGGFFPPPCFPKGCLNFPAIPDSMPLTIHIFDKYQRATGRLFCAVTPFLMITQCKATENWFAEHHPSWLDIGDLRATNNRIHYMMALIFLTIPMLIHMWIIFLPVAAGAPFKLLHIGEHEPEGRLNPFVAPDGSIFITPEDFLRLPFAILVFMILIPLSIANKTRLKGFTVSHYLHFAAAAIFLMDVMRGNHPHAQLWIAPFVIWYIFDRIIGIFWYRAGKALIIHKEQLDSNYVVVFLYIPKQKRKRHVGSVYYYGLEGKEGAGDFSHPFTSFQNHSAEPLLESWKNRDSTSTQHHYFIGEGRESGKVINAKEVEALDYEKEEQRRKAMEGQISSETEDRVFFSNWNTATVVQIHNTRGGKSFTARLAKKEIGDSIKFWGPYYSEYACLTPIDGLRPLVLMSSGAGINYILDFYTWLKASRKALSNPVQVYYSTDSLELFQFVTDLLCSKAIPFWNVSAHLTKNKDLGIEDNGEETEMKETKSSKRATERDASNKVALGRLSLEECILSAPRDSEVFFCGSPAIQWKIELLCAAQGLPYHPGSRFSPNAVREFHCVNGKPKARCTGFPCCCGKKKVEK